MPPKPKMVVDKTNLRWCWRCPSNPTAWIRRQFLFATQTSSFDCLSGFQYTMSMMELFSVSQATVNHGCENVHRTGLACRRKDCMMDEKYSPFNSPAVTREMNIEQASTAVDINDHRPPAARHNRHQPPDTVSLLMPINL